MGAPVPVEGVPVEAVGRPGVTAPVVVLACGALDRRDDAAGLLAARALRSALERRGVLVEAVGDLSVDDLVERDGASIVIVDAAAGPRPGEVLRLPFASLASSRARPRSSHELPIPEMVGLAELLAGEPLRGELVAIGIADAGYGDALTPAVAAGMPGFLAAVEAAVDDALAPGSAAVVARTVAPVGPVAGAGAPLADEPLTAIRAHSVAPSRRTHVVASPRRRAARWRRPFGARR